MADMNYQKAYDALKLRIKSLCDKALEPNLQVAIKGASNQKLTEQYIQLDIKQWDSIGTRVPLGLNKSGLVYEVMVDVSVHRPPSATSLVGTTTIQLNKIIHAFKAHSGTYFDSFSESNISFLRASAVNKRHWPIDRNQLEERSIVTCVFEVAVVEEDLTDVGWIESVDLTSKVKISDNNIIENNSTITE